jgi:hypothetical protein
MSEWTFSVTDPVSQSQALWAKLSHSRDSLQRGPSHRSAPSDVLSACMGVCCYTAQIHLISSRWAHTSTKHTLMWPLLVFLWIVLLLVFIDRRQRKTFSPNAPFVQPHYPILGNSLTVAKNLHMMLDMVSLSSHSVLHTRGHTQKKNHSQGADVGASRHPQAHFPVQGAGAAHVHQHLRPRQPGACAFQEL